MKYTIEIKDLQEGWEPVAYRIPAQGEWFVGAHGAIVQAEKNMMIPRLVAEPVTIKYDWTKTLPSVLVTLAGKALYRAADVDTPYPKVMELSTEWQPNLVGRCPVDPDACIVRVQYMDGSEAEKKAGTFSWIKTYHPGSIVCWKFVRLVDGYEW